MGDKIDELQGWLLKKKKKDQNKFALFSGEQKRWFKVQWLQVIIILVLFFKSKSELDKMKKVEIGV